MQFKIIKTDTNYILEQIEEIQKGSFAHKDIASLNGKCRHDTDMDGDCPYHKNGCPKLSEMTFTDEVAKVVGAVDLDAKAEKSWREGLEEFIPMPLSYKESFILGYAQAINDNKDRVYTEYDMRKAFRMGSKFAHGYEVSERTYNKFTGNQKPNEEVDENTFIKSLTPTSWNVEIETQQEYLADNKWVKQPSIKFKDKLLKTRLVPEVTSNTIKVISIKP